MRKIRKPVALIFAFATLFYLVSPLLGNEHHEKKHKLKKTAGIASDIDNAVKATIEVEPRTILEAMPTETIVTPLEETNGEVIIEETTTEPMTEEITTEELITEPTTEMVEETTTEEDIYIEETPTEIAENSYKEYPVYDDTGFKSWMPATAITNTSSAQFKLQQTAYTDPDTGIKMVDGRYCIAVGSYYTTTIGTYIDLVLENGTVIECILGDCKADKDTNSDNRIHTVDGSLVEFLVNKQVISYDVAYRYGDISYAKDGWNSKVVSIKIYE